MGFVVTSANLVLPILTQRRLFWAILTKLLFSQISYLSFHPPSPSWSHNPISVIALHSMDIDSHLPIRYFHVPTNLPTKRSLKAQLTTHTIQHNSTSRSSP